jgi:hypothetical protein
MIAGDVRLDDVGHGRRCTGSGREAHAWKCGTRQSGGRSGFGWCGLGGRRKDVGQFVDGGHLSIADGGEWGCRSRVADGPAEVNGCSNGGIGGGVLRHFSVMWKKFHSAGDAFGSGFGGKNLVAPVVFRCSAYIPSIDTMDRPSATTVWYFVDEDLCAGRVARGVFYCNRMLR